jgi:glycine cleavage system transcriptional repressor
LDCNIEAMSQTSMAGWFTMLLRVSAPAALSAVSIRDALEKADLENVAVCPAVHGNPSPGTAETAGDPFIVTATGEDCRGIVARLAACCAMRNVNIEDVWNEVHDGRFIIIFTITLPRRLHHRDFRQELEVAAEELGVNVMLQHQDIFTATNSLSFSRRPRTPAL